MLGSFGGIQSCIIKPHSERKLINSQSFFSFRGRASCSLRHSANSAIDGAMRIVLGVNVLGSARAATTPYPTTIKNRRSTLLGEKGFGLGGCGTWNFSP